MATKSTSQEEGFSNFLRPLMTPALPLMISLLTALAKSISVADIAAVNPYGITIRINSINVSNRYSYSKQILDQTQQH